MLRRGPSAGRQGGGHLETRVRVKTQSGGWCLGRTGRRRDTANGGAADEGQGSSQPGDAWQEAAGAPGGPVWLPRLQLPVTAAAPKAACPRPTCGPSASLRGCWTPGG